jgi:hypothetical protein
LQKIQSLKKEGHREGDVVVGGEDYMLVVVFEISLSINIISLLLYSKNELED